MLGLIALCAVGLPWYARNHLSAKQQMTFSRVMAVFISGTMVIWCTYLLAIGEFDWSDDLPLNLCNLIALVVVALMWRPKHAKLELLYFMVLSGTLQGVITPDLDEAFPHYNYFKYWVVHGGLVVYMIYACVVFRQYPRFKGIFRAYLWINVYCAVMMAYNLIAGTNFMYLAEKPPVPTLLDYLGPWPWYILTAQPLAVLLIWLSWLPFAKVSRQAAEVG